MYKLKYLPFFICLAFFSSMALIFFRWPFYEYTLVAAFISVPFILILPKRQLPAFLFVMLVALICVAVQEPAAAVTSIGNYFLLSVFHFSLWTVSEHIKMLGEEAVFLRAERESLLQKGRELRTLDLQEFVEQALWMLKTSNRQERTWLMEVKPYGDCPVQIRELERAALLSVVQECDLVTSRKGTVYLLIKETGEDSVQPLLNRIEQAIGAESEATKYKVTKTSITSIGEMGSLLS